MQYKKNWFSHIKSRLVLPYNIVKCKILDKYRPLVVLLYATDRCNLHCKYCQGHWSGRMIMDFSTKEIFNIVDECWDLGTRHITVHGGEILLMNDVKKIICHMKQKGFYVNLVTNGILLPQKIDEIRDVDSLCISLDGSLEANDANRGKGSYKEIVKAIRLAKSENFKLNVQATITRHNKDEVGYLAKLAKGIGYYQQFSLLLKPLSPDQDNIGLSDAETKYVLKEIIRYKKMGYPIFTSYRTLKNAVNWPYPYSKAMLNVEEFLNNNHLIRCYYGKLKIVIDADGFVYPCSSLNHEFKALNVKDVGVKRAYEHILKTNTCEACYFLTQNDWSLLLGLSPKQYLDQIKIQLKEIFNVY